MDQKNLIIIPTFNESLNIEMMIKTIFNLYPAISLLIVDDSSPDGTANLVKAYQAQYPNLHLINRTEKKGLGKAYVHAFRWAIEKDCFQNIITMDCDFSHNPNQVADLLKLANENSIVVGSRYVGKRVRISNWPLKRLILSKLAAIYSRFWTLMPCTDPTGGFNSYPVSAIKKLKLNNINSNGYCFQVELKFKLWKLKYKINEVGIFFLEREMGKSKLDRSIVWEAILKIPLLIFKN